MRTQGINLHVAPLLFLRHPLLPRDEERKEKAALETIGNVQKDLWRTSVHRNDLPDYRSIGEKKEGEEG